MSQSATSSPVILLGMHRSGTSLFSSILQASGVHMGEELLDVGADNKFGYFEDASFVHFQERCLNRRSMSYVDLDRDQIPVILTDRELDEARALLGSRIELSSWGWKDPRTCLFLPAWDALLPNARYVYVYRNPISVLASLLRRHEAKVLADPLVGLELWCIYNRAVLDFLDRRSPACVVIDAESLLTDPDGVAGALCGLGIPAQTQMINRLTETGSFTPTPGGTSIQDLMHTACPDSIGILNRLEEYSATREGDRVEEERSESLSRTSRLLPDHASRDEINAMLVANLSETDPMTSSSINSFSFDDRLEQERTVSRDHYTHVVRLQDEMIDLANRAQSAESALADERVAMRAKLDSNDELIGQLRSRIIEQDALRVSAESRLQDIIRGSDAVLRERDEALKNWHHYRKRWPPYIARAITRRVARRTHELIDRYRQMPDPTFGLDSRVMVLSTGLPSDESDAQITRACLVNQSIKSDLTIWPGDTPASSGTDQIRNWFAPDLPSLCEGSEITLLMHTERYGPGPLWNAQGLEMIRAAFASDPKLSALVFRGEPGLPSTGSPNHLYETDNATIGTWDEQSIAIAVRSGELPRVFSESNHAEQRNFIPVLQRIQERGKKLLVVPRTFPLRPADAKAASTSIGLALPEIDPGGDQPIRALYLTQWLECGGADKGVLDLVNRVDPSIVRFSVMTTSAATHPWAPRVAGHVDEMVHLGDHLPLPADRRFPEFIAEYIRRRGIELVHIMHSLQGCDATKRIKELCPHVQIIDQCHILEKKEFVGGGHPVYASKLVPGLLDRRTVTNHWLKKNLVENHDVRAQDISVIYTCVDAKDEFNPDTYAAGVFRDEIGIESSSPLVVFLGRLHGQKRPELFAQVARRVTQMRPDLGAYFVMVGTGDLLLSVESERQRMTDPSRLILAGEKTHSGPILRDADLMLMLSEREGLAYVSFEAMSMGVPQIFTDVNAQNELVVPDTGVLLDIQDTNELVNAATEHTIELLDHRDKLDAMGIAARARILEQFQIDTMVKEYETLYTSLVRRDRPAGSDS